MKSGIKLVLVVTLLVQIFSWGCGAKYEEKGSTDYINGIKDWQTKRVDGLKNRSIWLKLAGLYWLDEGENTFGSDKENKIVFPEKAASKMGSIFREENKLTLKVAEGIEITVDSNAVKEMDLISDGDGEPTFMRYGALNWYIIKRGEDRFGIRLIDDEHPALKEFKGIPTFPVNEDWKFAARWEAYNPVKIIEIPSVIGTVSKDTCYGAILFTVDGQEQRLEAPGNGENLFVIFADRTSGEETYGAGRFLSAKRNLETGEVELDFNKAYNPPCAFSKYATCPLPPEQNRLKIKVTAGERFEGHH